MSLNYIYKLIKTVFSNIEYIKNHPDHFFKQTIENVLPSQILQFNSLLKMHKGALAYYNDIGVVTYNSNLFCSNFAGTGKCENVEEKRHYGHGYVS